MLFLCCFSSPFVLTIDQLIHPLREQTQNGCYILKIFTDNGIIHRKLIIMN